MSVSDEAEKDVGVLGNLIFIVICCGVFLFSAWVLYIGPWKFDNFMVDILPWRTKYITSMKITHYIGHYTFFGFVALASLVGAIGTIGRLIGGEESKEKRQEKVKEP